MTTNYPDLHTYYQNQNPITVQVEENVKVTVKGEPLDQIQPEQTIYRDYVSSSNECIVSDEIQTLSKGIIKVREIEIYESTEKSNTTFLQWTPDYGFWTMLELATEMLRFNNQPKYNSKVSINVNSVKIKNNHTTTKSSTNSTSSTNLLALHQELSDLKTQLLKLEEDLRNGNYISKKETEKKIERLKKKIIEKEKLIKEYQDNNNNNNNDLILRILIGSIGLLSLPILGKFSGKDIGLMMYLVSLRRTQFRCSKLMKETEKDQKANPHWGLVNSTLMSWQQASSKLLVHTSISLFCKLAAGAGAVVGFVGAYKNNDMLMTGTLAFTLSISGLLLEKLRYKTIDQSTVHDDLRIASVKSHEILNIKSPYEPNPLFGQNPEWREDNNSSL